MEIGADGIYERFQVSGCMSISGCGDQGISVDTEVDPPEGRPLCRPSYSAIQNITSRLAPLFLIR